MDDFGDGGIEYCRHFDGLAATSQMPRGQNEGMRSNIRKESFELFKMYFDSHFTSLKKCYVIDITLRS